MTNTIKGVPPRPIPVPIPRPGKVVVDRKRRSTDPKYGFMREVKQIVESGQSSSLVLSGNIGDLFFSGDANNGRGAYVPLVEYFKQKYSPVRGLILIVAEVYGAIRFQRESDKERLKEAWVAQRTGLDMSHSSSWKQEAANLAEEARKKFDQSLLHAIGKPTVMIEFLKELCMCSRHVQDGVTSLSEKLVIIIEGADTIFPEGEMSRLHDADRRRVARCHDWFKNPDFMNGYDTVILLSEAKGLLNDQLARMPQLLEVTIPSPDEGKRMHCIGWFTSGNWRPVGDRDGESAVTFPDGAKGLAKWTAGLSIHALLQLLKGATFNGGTLSQKDVISKVEKFISSQLGGDDVVEFKKPTHRLDDLVGNTGLKFFLRSTLIPRFKMTGKGCLSGVKVCGPIGGGKTHIFEAVAAELDIPVLVLKNLRSKWYGGTDVIFGRLRRVLDALAKVLIFVDEADTQFGDVSKEGHQTEKRLTGKLLSMMSDPQLKGRVLWLLMTARIHLLPPDMLRAGRAGDLVIPVLDAEGEDKQAFLEWVIEECVTPDGVNVQELAKKLESATPDYYAGCYASLRDELLAEQARKKTMLSEAEILTIAEDVMFPDIKEVREYQTLKALINTTRRSLLPDPKVSDEDRKKWHSRCAELEANGVT